MIARVVTLLVVATIVAAPTVTADPGAMPPPDRAVVPAPQTAHPGLSPLLNQLYDSVFGSADPARRAGLRHLIVNGDSVEVVAVSRTTAAGPVADRVRQLGGHVASTYGELVFATVPIAELHMLASDPSVLRVRTPYRSQPDVVSEGVAVHHADVLHDQGITGQGVKVGVLDCGGFSGYEALLGSELPPAITLWTGGSQPVGSGNHGTACAEVVYDMAPGAEMYLAHDYGEAEFYAAIDWFIAEGVSVISYSCRSMGDFPGDGRGDPYNPLNQKVSDARDAGVLFVGSAGNYANGANYESWFEQFPGYNWHSFVGDWGNRIGYLEAGSSYYIALTWNDWPDDPQTQGATQNYNLGLYWWDGANWQIVATSMNPQSCQAGEIPFEEIWYTPSVGDWYYLVIYDDGTTAPGFLSLRSFRSLFQHSNPEYSVYAPETPDGMTIGAVFWNDLGLEPFSSQGPLFGPGGVPDGGALAPQLVGADGVSGVTYGPSNGQPWSGGGTGFFGTSASCPHVAGGAVLLLSANPGLTVDQLEDLLLAGATDMGPPGPDSQYGYGLMNLEAGSLFSDGFESGDTSAWSATVP
jgi:subtilisin family serine protease